MSLVGSVRRWPLACYFVLVFALSGVALIVIGLPRLYATSGRSGASLVMFPVMVLGVGLTGISLTAITDGASGLKALRSRLRQPVRRHWLLILVLPPVAILGVLEGLQAVDSSRFAPGFFVFGFAAGAVAGFFEELGWTGFAYPRMRDMYGAVGGALLLGVLWGLWHLPVVDSLGATNPHGHWWPEFFAAFISVLVALRVLIAWVYTNTGSLRMAQLLHAASTGSLVILGAHRATPAQESVWYLAYAAVLASAAMVVVALQGSTLGGRGTRRPHQQQAPMSIPAGS